MGEVGNPYDNAVAERINGILKNEFYLNATFTDFNTALKATRDSINIYNHLRPHMALDYQTPVEKYAAQKSYQDINKRKKKSSKKRRKKNYDYD